MASLRNDNGEAVDNVGEKVNLFFYLRMSRYSKVI